jgi:hypothetical protein
MLSMRERSSFLRNRGWQLFLWIMVAFAAVTLFAPGKALAHEGHAHHQSHSAAPVTHSLVAETKVASSVKTDCHGKSASLPEKTSPDCPCGCSMGMSCCGIILAAELPTVLSPLARQLPFEHPLRRLSGRVPASLLEPPNALV